MGFRAASASPPHPTHPHADALRYTLATGTSPGQDVNLSLERVNSNRNFTNKLWNAGKFVLFNLEQASGGLFEAV
jgi:valyl-tRNA synthetase